MGNSKDYEQLKQRVLDQKSTGSVIPRDLYKLASLMARWEYRGKLPVCLLCRDVSKTTGSLGHLIPFSVLKLDRQPGETRRAFDHITGRAVALAKMGYYAFCKDCELRFSKHGENFFTAQFKPFYEKPDEKIEVKTLTSVGHPWLFFCLISIIWRCMAFIPKNDEFFDLLEILRSYILSYPDSAELPDVKLSIFAPNKTIQDKLAQDPPAHRRFFYEMYHAKFDIIPESEGYKGNIGWLFLGPFHVYMVYFSPPDFEKFGLKIPDTCTLTTGQETFTLESRDERFFPEEGYKMTVEHGKEMLTTTLRLPLLKPADTNSTINAQFLHLLPEFVTYDRNDDKFSFPRQYEEQCALCIPVPRSSIVSVKKRDMKIIFIAIHSAIVDGNELAMALKYNPGGDDHLHYAQGYRAPDPDRITADLSEPPFKELIKSLIANIQLFQDG